MVSLECFVLHFINILQLDTQTNLLLIQIIVSQLIFQGQKTLAIPRF